MDFDVSGLFVSSHLPVNKSMLQVVKVLREIVICLSNKKMQVNFILAEGWLMKGGYWNERFTYEANQKTFFLN
jgi:hypothetical protein